jgi:hypothetical protein
MIAVNIHKNVGLKIINLVKIRSNVVGQTETKLRSVIASCNSSFVWIRNANNLSLDNGVTCRLKGVLLSWLRDNKYWMCR